MRQPDGSFAEGGFTVETDGGIYFTSPTQRQLVARLED